MLNKAADTLSRLSPSIGLNTLIVLASLDVTKVKKPVRKDELFSKIISELENVSDNVAEYSLQQRNYTREE